METDNLKTKGIKAFVFINMKTFLYISSTSQ